jgi:hypothetical protein
LWGCIVSQAVLKSHHGEGVWHQARQARDEKIETFWSVGAGQLWQFVTLKNGYVDINGGKT